MEGNQHIVGYIEVKDPRVEYLDQIETTEQLKRYRHTFPNLILTNFFEFRLYRNGALVDKVLISRPFVIHKLKTIPPVEKESEFFNLLQKFFSFSFPKLYNAKALAIELAKRTRFLREEVVTQELKSVVDQTFLSDNDKKQTDNDKKQAKMSVLHGFFEAFRKFLISGLSTEDFADLYSQTLTYGLFAARTRSENGFNRKLAYDRIPRTIGILRDVFKFISLGDLPQQMEWIVDDISEVLAVTDVKNILHQYFHEGKGKDPIVHFYETFLAEYDPETREKRGVYYTPEAVVSYIVRLLHIILKEKFGKSDGFANSSVAVLDPAAGTLTFLAEAAKLAVEEFVSKYGEGGKENLIKEHILKNFYAFELMMAPYAVGHLKMSFLLEELGYRLQRDDRFKLYLTNTLEIEELAQTELPGMASLSKESHLAGKVKKETPILVILGNPPYSVSSANKSDFIEEEMELYKEDVRAERNIQPLSDDYIKFIRFAHWKIEKVGKGIIGMITNNSYLSGLIHRGMRKKLLESFNEIYILNLHGNSRIGEKCPDGSPDENVFDIMQGVSIALFIKNKKQEGLGKIFYLDVYGLRESKYDYLDTHDIKSTKWKELQPPEPYYFFVKKDFSLQAGYTEFWSITEIFNRSSSGVKTHRDHFIVGFTAVEVKQRIQTFISDLPDELVKQALNLRDTRDWKIKTARESVKRIDWKKYVISYSYRPFDIRFICYLPNLIDRGSDRWDLMQNFFEENLGLTAIRSESKYVEFSHISLSSFVTDIHYTGGQTYVFPLYLYPDTNKKDLFSNLGVGQTFVSDKKGRKPNINPELIKVLTEIYNPRKVGQTFLSDPKDLPDNETDNNGGTDKNVCSTDGTDTETDNEELKIARRHLPHWTLKGATYFVTFRTVRGELSVEEQKLVLEHIIEGNEKFYTLIAAVVMPDHAHLLLTPKEEYSLGRIMKGIKGASARQVNLRRTDTNVHSTKRGTSGSIWQDESFDRIIRDQSELNEKLSYMLNNPVKRGLTESPWDYHGWYFNDKTERTDKNEEQTGMREQTGMSVLL